MIYDENIDRATWKVRTNKIMIGQIAGYHLEM